MKILFDVNHPAHIHFFRNAISLLVANGHDVLVTSRGKECLSELLAELGVEHSKISDMGHGSFVGFVKEYFIRCFRLIRFVQKHKPDVMCAVGGTFVAHVGWLTKIPTIVFYDTEMASFQNKITYPFVSYLALPNCYQGPVPSKTVRYSGYHELAYLRPDYFTPDRAVAVRAGLSPNSKNFIVRVVSWQANHDVDQSGWSSELLTAVVAYLTTKGTVIISSERVLPVDVEHFRYRGTALQMHHLMAHCDLFVGESATMAAECAVLGVPAIYASETSRGYLDDIERRYALILVLREFEFGSIVLAVEKMLESKFSWYSLRKNRLLSETTDVTKFLIAAIESQNRNNSDSF